ncbi:hypothetical protein HYALB_00005803 [Hymenoscyphus albidus]|uniref:Uncharacterized protein n=1 Tax=Hymenoscyphus albidus TaxID=595503 RepID=A0A9N9LL22_9HELO|nr:hypothetical protein HYALB_00005803 [Hymenoscyphus albidus]
MTLLILQVPDQRSSFLCMIEAQSASKTISRLSVHLVNGEHVFCQHLSDAKFPLWREESLAALAW